MKNRFQGFQYQQNLKRIISWRLSGSFFSRSFCISAGKNTVCSQAKGYEPCSAKVKTNGFKRLPRGYYELFLCGTTSIMDVDGNKINDGKDVIRRFEIESEDSGEPDNVSDSSSGNSDKPLTCDDLGCYYYEGQVKYYYFFYDEAHPRENYLKYLQKTRSSGILPGTGFAPGVYTPLKVMAQPHPVLPSAVVLDIHSLHIKSNILGVPEINGSYDISWLGENIGWLQNTAFPGRLTSGNSVLTGHVVNNEGKPGVFFHLENLKYGNEIRITAFGECYHYSVVSNEVVYADTPQVLSQKVDKSLLTLLTCKFYNEKTGEYDGRVVVTAVLNDITRK